MKNNSTNRFLLSFIGLFAIYYFAMTFERFRELMTQFAAFNSNISKYLMKIFGYDTNIHGNILFSQSGSIEVGIGCDGSEPILVIIAGILASKASLVSKSLGIIFGIITILFFNAGRIIGLFYVSNSHKDNFDIFHNDIFPVSLMVLSIAIFIFWNKKFAKK